MSSTVCPEDSGSPAGLGCRHLVTLQPSEEGSASSVYGTAGVNTLTVRPAAKTRFARC